MGLIDCVIFIEAGLWSYRWVIVVLVPVLPFLTH